MLNREIGEIVAWTIAILLMASPFIGIGVSIWLHGAPVAPPKRQKNKFELVLEVIGDWLAMIIGTAISAILLLALVWWMFSLPVSATVLSIWLAAGWIIYETKRRA